MPKAMASNTFWQIFPHPSTPTDWTTWPCTSFINWRGLQHESDTMLNPTLWCSKLSLHLSSLHTYGRWLETWLFHFRSCSLIMHLGYQQNMTQDHRPLYPHRSFRSSEFLALAWSTPSHCSYLWSESANGKTLNYAFQINKNVLFKTPSLGLEQ